MVKLERSIKTETWEKLEKVLRNVTRSEAQRYLVKYLVNQTENFFAEHPRRNYHIMARICSLRELQDIEERNYENLGSRKDYGSDDPNADVKDGKMYFFNLDAIRDHKNTTYTLKKELGSRIDRVREIHEQRVAEKLETGLSYDLNGVAIVLMNGNTRNEAVEAGELSFKNKSIYAVEGKTTVQLEESSMSPQVLKKCEIITANDLYAELNVKMDNTESWYEDIVDGGSDVLKQFVSEKIAALETPQIELTEEEKMAVESVQSLVENNGDRMDEVYKNLNFLGLTSNALNYCVQEGLLDGENESVIALSESLDNPDGGM